MTPTRVALHNLAYELHMTVGQLTSSMTPREFADWVHWFTQRNAAQQPADLPAGSAVGMRLDLTTQHGVQQLATMFG